MLRRLVAYLRGLARRREIRGEIDEELRFHVEQQIEAHMQRGLPAAEARRRAHVELGGLTQTREAVNDVRSTWFDSVWRDLELSVRLLRKERTFTLTVSTTLALCLGANATLFAVIDHVLLRPLPLPAPDPLVITGNRYPKAGVNSGYSTSAADYVDRLSQTTVFQEQALFKLVNRGVDEHGVPTRVTTMGVTPSFFRLAQIPAVLGRTFTEDESEPGRETKTVLSFAFWQAQFGGDSGVVGRDVRIDGRPYTVVGVMPRQFALIDQAVQVWTPLTLAPADRTAHFNDLWGYVARLKNGASIERAKAEIDAVNRSVLDRYPQAKKIITGAGFYTVVTRLDDSLVGDVRPALRLMWGGALFLLLIGALNVTNVVLARARARTKEFATRVALGAGAGRLSRQLITEHVVLALVSSAAGLVVGWFGLRALGYLNVQDLPRGADIHFDTRTIAFTLLVGVMVGVVIGVITALAVVPRAPHCSLNDAQRSTTVGPGAKRLQRTLVVTQVAVAFVLLIGAGLLFSSFRRVLQIDPGFQSGRVLTASVSLPPSRYRNEPAVRQFIDKVLTGLRAVPSIAAAGATDTIPFGTNHTTSLIMAEGYVMRPGESVIAPAKAMVSPGYFEALHARLIAGRLFDQHDVETAPGVAIVDQALSDRFWPGASAIGRRLYHPDDPNDLQAITPTTQMFTVVGVIAPMRLDQLVENGTPTGAYFFPLRQQPARLLTFAIRSDASPAAVSAPLRAAVTGVDPELPVFDMQPMETWTMKSLANRRTAMWLSVIFGCIALLLAAVGVYGVLAYLVAQRRKEIGIRLALGATGRLVFAIVMREGLVTAAVGLGLGAAGVFGIRRVLESQLFQVTATDPLVLGGMTLVLVIAAAAACIGPAWRASRIDPRAALLE